MEQDTVNQRSVEIRSGSKIMSSIVVFVALSIVVYFFFKDGLVKFAIFEVVLAIFLLKNIISKDGGGNEAKQVAPKIQKLDTRIMYSFLVILIINVLVYFLTKNVGGILFFDSIVGLVFFAYLYYGHKKENEILMKEIASDLQCSYSKDGDSNTLDGLLFTLGNSRKIENIFSGNFNEYPFRVFDFSFKTGTGESAYPYKFTFFELSTGSKFPDMVISSNGEAYTSVHQLEREIIKENEEVIMEGDFSNFFSVRVEKGEQMEIRQILTPDIMVYLIDKTPSYSFIFSNGKVYICFKNFYSGPDAQGSFSKVEFLKSIEESKYLISKWLPSLTKMG